MPETIKYGIFGSGEVTRNDDGFITMHAIIEESGLYAGIPPEELRIQELLPPDYTDEEIAGFLKEENEKRDLPLYHKKVLVKVLRN